MLIYVAHKYGGDMVNVKLARKIVHDLQVADTENLYVCPLLALSHIEYDELGRDAEMELCLDLLSACDKLVVASEISEGVQAEVDFAELVGMEVDYVEENNGI